MLCIERVSIGVVLIFGKFQKPASLILVQERAPHLWLDQLGPISLA